MIVSIVELESEHEGSQKILVRGSSIAIATELTNIMREVLKRGFPEELLIDAIMKAVESNHKK